MATCFPRASQAASLTVAWDPPTDGLTTGYLVSYGTVSNSYSQQIVVGYTTSYTVSNLTAGTTYYFAVQAYDAAGAISGYSNEASATAQEPGKWVTDGMRFYLQNVSYGLPLTSDNTLATIVVYLTTSGC